MRWIIAGISTLAKLLNQAESDSTCNMLKTKSSKEQRDTKESKIDKLKKESEIFNDELSGWKPWHHIWPKDPSSRFTSAPLYNPGGKYCLKIFWMVSFWYICQFNTIKYNAIQYNTIRTMQNNTIQCNAMQCNAIQYSLLNTMYFINIIAISE